MIQDAIRETISRYSMLATGDRVLVGVSGGADSVCLLRVLKDLGYEVAAVHLNHCLRGNESDEDEAFVRRLCERMGVPCHFRRTDISGLHGNVEAAGRQERKNFFSELVVQRGFDRIALAHNRDDRVETFLLNLFRGSGASGLASMEPVAGRIVRPLIERSRAEIEHFLRHNHQEWRTDSTNQDRRFVRNRLRLDVLPELRAVFNPNLSETLTRTIAILEEENRFLDGSAGEWLQQHGTKKVENFVIDAEALVSKPLGLQRRVLRLMLREAGSNLENVTFEHLESIRELLEPGRSGKRIEVPGGWCVERSFGQMLVRSNLGPVPEFEYELQIPGEIHIPEIRYRFRAKVVTESDNNPNVERVFVDGSGLGPCVRIRNWRPGDYYRPVGWPGGKLKKLFQRARIPRNQRHQWPVLVADSSIVWVASFPVSREFAPRGCSQKIVAFEASEDLV
jgi:tRNA(Ile)-lysidine synthase